MGARHVARRVAGAGSSPERAAGIAAGGRAASGSVDLEVPANGECVEDLLELLAGVVDERPVDVDVLETQPAGGAVGEEAFEGAVAGV